MQTRTALVTGASRGIGAAVAIALSQRGYRLILTARDAAALEETAAACPGPAIAAAGDITSADFVTELFARAEATYGVVDVLIANAGAATAAPLSRTTDEDWNHAMELNLTAPFRCIRRAVPSMTSRGWGRIVVVASVAAKVGERYISAYTASKHGVLGLVRSAADELGRSGVTVNAVCPGYVDTPMTDASIANIVAKTGLSSDEARARLESKQGNGRLITTEEVAAAVLTCVDNPAINGQGINLDGGAVQS